mmetsp:Transcript_85121/g.249280  ORF Transcript_85121/g.249280 Transcript_85121/m.249280 type:complete len:99 (+) Transcript_85121:468-764(+)
MQMRCRSRRTSAGCSATVRTVACLGEGADFMSSHAFGELELLGGIVTELLQRHHAVKTSRKVLLQRQLTGAATKVLPAEVFCLDEGTSTQSKTEGWKG